MACGFAKPIFGLLALSIVTPFLPTRNLAIAWMVGLVTLLSVGDLYARFRARHLTSAWYAQHGYSAPRWKRRGGFVSWGISVWSCCEILPFEFDDNTGVTHNVLLDVCAPVFGFWVKSQVMANPNTVFNPESLNTEQNGTCFASSTFVQHGFFARPRLRRWSIVWFAASLASVTRFDLPRRGHRLFGMLGSFW